MNFNSRKAAICCLAAVLFIYGCSNNAIRTDSPASTVSSIELKGVPHFPQQSYYCGPATLATMLNFSGLAITPSDLAATLYIPELHGSLQIELLAETRHLGRMAYPLSSELEDLFAELTAGNPVLVLQNLGLTWWPKWHYAVLTGFDLTKNTVQMQSGGDPLLVRSIPHFLQTWQRAGSWAIVITPPGELPLTAELNKSLLIISELEQSGAYNEAVKYYQALTRRWPKSDMTWMGLGNSLYATKQYEASSVAFRNALEITPSLVPGWNNIAYALAASGCNAQALQALACLKKFTDDQFDIDQIKSELDLIENPRHDCPVITCND